MTLMRVRIQRTGQVTYVEQGTGRYWRKVEGGQPQRCLICGLSLPDGWYAEGGERTAPQFRCVREARVAPNELTVATEDGVQVLLMLHAEPPILPAPPALPQRPRPTTPPPAPQTPQPKLRLIRTVWAGVTASRRDARRIVYRAECEYRSPDGATSRFTFEIEPDLIAQMVIPHGGTPHEISQYAYQWSTY